MFKVSFITLEMENSILIILNKLNVRLSDF